MGKPTISPRTEGIRDYFPTDSMIFFEPGNAQDLARKIENVAFHYSDALDMAERGQRIYLEHTWSRERHALIDAVDKLLNGKQTSMTSASHGHRAGDGSSNSVIFSDSISSTGLGGVGPLGIINRLGRSLG